MRTDQEIQGRIRFLLSQELDRRVSDARERLPHKCVHNHRQPLDVRKELLGDPNEDYNKLDKTHLPVIGLCMKGSDNVKTWPGTICEDPIDAKRCPFYTPKETKSDIEETLSSNIKDLSWVSANMPEVASLLWVLGSESMPKLPLWKRLWFRLIRIRPEPLTLPSRFD